LGADSKENLAPPLKAAVAPAHQNEHGKLLALFVEIDLGIETNAWLELLTSSLCQQQRLSGHRYWQLRHRKLLGSGISHIVTDHVCDAGRFEIPIADICTSNKPSSTCLLHSILCFIL